MYFSPRVGCFAHSTCKRGSCAVSSSRNVDLVHPGFSKTVSRLRGISADFHEFSHFASGMLIACVNNKDIACNCACTWHPLHNLEECEDCCLNMLMWAGRAKEGRQGMIEIPTKSKSF